MATYTVTITVVAGVGSSSKDVRDARINIDNGVDTAAGFKQITATFRTYVLPETGGYTVNWSVTAPGCVTQRGTVKQGRNRSITVTLIRVGAGFP